MRPRLLPMTIVAMTALLGLKSVVLMQATASESDSTARKGAAVAGQAVPAQAGTRRPDARPTDARGPEGRRANEQPPTGTDATALPGAPPQARPDQLPPLSDAERGLLLDLRHRRLTLEARARDLDLRQAELAAANQRLADRLAQLTALQTRLEALETSRQQHSTENWAGLVKVYEAMKARDAAAIFDVLDMQVLLQVLDRMQERRAAAVLAAMQPDRARLATQMLAELRTRAVTPAPVVMPGSKG